MALISFTFVSGLTGDDRKEGIDLLAGRIATSQDFDQLSAALENPDEAVVAVAALDHQLVGRELRANGSFGHRFWPFIIEAVRKLSNDLKRVEIVDHILDMMMSHRMTISDNPLEYPSAWIKQTIESFDEIDPEKLSDYSKDILARVKASFGNSLESLQKVYGGKF